ncbi:MAG: PTS sugar transporter subunit IIA [Chlamydiales bacterium]
MAILARINFKRREPVTIDKYLDTRRIAFLHATSRDVALRALVEVLDADGALQDKEAYYSAILNREKIVSTGIGMGVAIPHAKLEGYEDFFIAIGIQQGQGLEWNSLDGAPVRLIIMIGGPANQQTEYLYILSKITIAIKDEERRKKLLKAKTAEEVVALFQGT